MAKTKTGKRKAPTPEHLEAMDKGRKAARAVSQYLDALATSRPPRGRRVSPETLQARLDEARIEVESASGLARLNAAQSVIDLERRLEQANGPTVDLSELEDGFVEWAPVYATSKGITYQAFREVGVPAAVLKRAGLSRAQQ